MFDIAKFYGLNEEQTKAIDINKNISLSAGAGSGKTRVLTSRYLNLLQNGIDINEIIAITFTEKAALEMKERIREGILERIADENDEDREFWQRALDNLNKANISTIHSFCGNIVRENAAYLGIDFNFNLINEIDKRLFLDIETKKIINNCFNNVEYSEVINYFKNYLGDKYILNSFTNELLKCREHILESGYSIDEIHENSKHNNIIEFIVKIISEIDNVYKHYKINNDMLDFTDLQRLAIELLDNDKIQRNYRNRFTRFLVDEFQDTNEIQKKILYKLTSDEYNNISPKRLFVVGDFKQSIYGFRGADSRVFEKVTKDIGEEGKKALLTCYRSEREIVAGINEIFSKLINNYQPLMPKGNEENEEKRIKIVTYNKEGNENLNKIAIKEIKEIIKNKSYENDELINKLNEIKNIHDTINTSTSKEDEDVIKSIFLLRDKGLEFKDICILIRSRFGLLSLEEELNKYKIPYSIIGGLGFFDKPETNELLNLYELVVNKFDDKLCDDKLTKLIGVLRGPLFNIPDDILLRIKKIQNENNFINYIYAIKLLINNLENEEEKKKLKYAHNILKNLENISDRFSVIKILNLIIKLCKVKEIYICMRDGNQKIRNIEKILNLAKDYDNEHVLSPLGFINHIEILKDLNSNESEAALDTEESNAVKIMTIHASKGLQFGGVIIPGYHKNRTNKTEKEFKKLGFIYNEGNVILRLNEDGNENEDYKAIKEERILRSINEEIRVLYVAMTRAKYYIVLTGQTLNEEINNIDEINSYYHMLNYAISNKANTENIEVINGDELNNIIPLIDINITENVINEDEINNKLTFNIDIKPKTYGSASKYMKYKLCPRKYYYENIIKANNKEFEIIIDEYENEILDNIAIELDETENVEKPIISAAEKGTLIHLLLEHIDKYGEDNLDNFIEENLNDLGIEDDNKANVKNELLRFIENYKEMDNNENLEEKYGNLIIDDNEVYYLLSPLEDKKMNITGFIDKLRIYKKDHICTAVIIDYKSNKIRHKKRLEILKETYINQLLIYGKAIKDLIYVDGNKIDNIVLKLYFLDSKDVVNIDYDENIVNNLLNDMDESFSIIQKSSSIHEYPKHISDKCKNCKYHILCKDTVNNHNFEITPF